MHALDPFPNRGPSVLLLVLLMASALGAQEAQDPESERPADELDRKVAELQEVVVTATRNGRDPFEVPFSADSVPLERLAIRRVPTTLPEALREIPGTMMQKTGPGLDSPFIRGLTGFRTVLLIDGVRLNNSVFRDGPNQYWATVDPLGLGRIELVKGPSSVLWGTDAIGGTVQALTPSLDYGVAGEGWRVGGRAYYRFDMARAGHVARLEFEGGHEGALAFRIGGTYRSFGDIDAGNDFGRQPGTGYDADFLDAKIGWRVSESADLELLVQRARLNNVPRTHSTINGRSFAGTTVGSDLRRDFDQDRDLVLLTTRLYDGTFFEEATIRFAWHAQDEVQDRIRSSGRRDLSSFEVDTFSLSSEVTSETALGTLVWGADLSLDLVDSSARRIATDGTVTNLPQGPVGDEAWYLTLGLFAEDRIDLGRFGELTVGVRYTHVATEIDRVFEPVGGTLTSIDESWDSVVGSIGLLVTLDEHVHPFARIGTGFRAPNLSDLSRLDTAQSGELEIASPGLDPEYFLGLEAGVKARWGDFSAQAAYFYTFLFDTIVRTPTGATIDNELVVVKSNVGDGFIQGVELAARWEFVEDWTLGAQFSWTEGRADAFPTSMPVKVTESLSRTPPIYGRVSLGWEPEGSGFWAEISTEMATRADRLNSANRRDTQRIPPNGTPGYVILNLRTGYAFDEKRSVFLHLENLTDQNYRIHGSGVQEPGFNAVVGFDLRF